MKAMKLHIKIMLLMVILMVGVISVLYIVFSEQMNNSMEDQMGISALDFARTVAGMEYIQEGLYHQAEHKDINHYVEEIRQGTEYQYIIVMDMDGIQYSYPYDSGVGKIYKNGGEHDVLELGKTYVSADRNELISAIRGFAPVYREGQQVGAVLVGLLTDTVQQEIRVNRRNLEIALVVSVFVSIVSAVLLSMNIKKSMFNLEPAEIAMLISERELIFNSIEKCLVSVDKNGVILFYNNAAATLLGLPEGVEGKQLSSYNTDLATIFEEVLVSEDRHQNEQFFINRGLHVIINTCLMYNPNKEVFGLVSSIDQMNQAIELAYELTDYKAVIDSLRAQNHEFMNKLHTLGGLIQLGNYEEALNYIDMLSIRSKELQHILVQHIQNKKVAGIILAKYNKFVENKLEFRLDKASKLSSLPKNVSEEIVCSIIGNLLDNSFEAIINHSKSDQGFVELFVQSNEEGFELQITNNGPRISEDVQKEMFKKGYTTKNNRSSKNGQGLYIIHQEIIRLNGEIYSENLMNQEGVSWYVKIPK